MAFLQLLVTALRFSVIVAALNHTRYVPGAYMVEFEENHDHDTFVTALQSKRTSVSTRVILDSDVFRGASYQLDRKSFGQDPVSTLSAMPAVKQVWPVAIIERPAPQIHWIGDNPSSIPTQLKARVKVDDDKFIPHVLTQVDRLHAEGLTGKGVKIGIIDEGLDYKHPALGGCFGSGCLVARGYDVIGDNWVPGETLQPDNDPYMDCDGHATHVAGIIAAQRNDFEFLGAAAGVELGAYRVLNCNGQGTADSVTAGIIKAYEDGNDIITASLGGSGNWAETPQAEIIERMIAKGIVFTLAAGNDGSSGPFSTGSPASAKGSTAIASVNNLEIPRVLYNASYTIDNSTTALFGWAYGSPDGWGNGTVTLPLYIEDSNLGNTTACPPTYKNAPSDLSGYIVLLKSNSYCGDFYAASPAAKRGAKYMLFFRESESTYEVNFPDLGGFMPGPNGTGSIPASTAKRFIELQKSGKHVSLSITNPKEAKQYSDSVPNEQGGYLSYFTSWGPTWELDGKPDIATPGMYILSTWPLNHGKYAVLSGTSMATPLAAGIYALLIEAKGKLAVAELTNLLSSTAKPLRFFNDTTPLADLAPVLQQGGGLAQAWDAVHANSTFSTSSMLLNDTDHLEQIQKLAIKNTATKDTTYVLGHQKVPAFYALNADALTIAALSQIELAYSYADISFSSQNLTLSPGQAVTLTATFTPPKGLAAGRLPFYSGYITVDSSIGDHYSVPYFGVAGSLHKAQSIQTASIYRSDNNPYYKPPNGFTFPILRDVNSTNTTGTIEPCLEIVRPIGTAVLEAQVWSVGSAVNGTNSTGPLAKNYGSWPALPSLYEDPAREGSFASLWSCWQGYQGQSRWPGDGERVPEGSYSVVVRALKIFGDRAKDEDWESRRTIDFVVKYV